MKELVKYMENTNKLTIKTSLLLILIVLLLSAFPEPVLSAKPALESSMIKENLFFEKFFLNINDGMVNLVARDIPLQPIIKEIGRRTGIKIHMTSLLGAKEITVNWQNVTLEDALKKIAGNSGLIFSKDTKGEIYLSEVYVASESVEELTEKNEKKSVEAVLNNRVMQKSEVDIANKDVSGSGLSKTGEPDTEANFVINEIVIRFNPDFPEKERNQFLSDTNIKIKKHIAALNYHILSLPDGMTYYDALVLLKRKKILYTAEPNYLIPVKNIPDDPKFSLQWGLNNTADSSGTEDADIDASEAWDIETGSREVIIAVIDTGVDYNHEDLRDNIWHNSNEIPDNNVDDDNNGYIDDIVGWDFVDASSGYSGEDYNDPDNDPMDMLGHGTHVAGIAAAAAGNGTGIAGVAYGSRIMAVRAGYKDLSGSGVLESADAAQAILYAADNGAKIINLSWGDYRESNLIKSAIDAAAEKGVVICAAAGNDNSSDLMFPAATDNPNIIAVGATDNNDNRSYYSGYGEWVHVSAPGKNIYSTKPGNSYGYMSGTSMAVPFVSGVAALLFSNNPDITSLEVKAKIMDSADYVDSLDEKNITSGRVNAYNALTVGSPVPYIFMINPARAQAEETVTISGFGFGEPQGAGYVTVSGYTALDVISWSDTRIVCRAPSSEQSGNVTVTTADGTSNRISFSVVVNQYDQEYYTDTFLSAGEGQGWKGDDKSWSYDLPFTFEFFGSKYDSVYVSSNGFLDFTNNNSSYLNSIEKLKGRTIIAPLWNDFIINEVDSLQDIYIHMPSTDSLCIRWKAETFSKEGEVNFEVILHKDGRIQFNYGDGNSELSPVVGISAGDGEEYVVSEYNELSELGNVESVLFVPQDQIFTLSIKNGWNLVSVPIQPYKTGIKGMLGDAYYKIESIWSYTDSLWKTHVPAMTEVSGLNSINESCGYWIMNKEDAVKIKIQGDEISDPVELAKGWNLVGYKSLSVNPVSEEISSILDKVDVIWAYKNEKWIVYDSNSPDFSDLTHFEPGLGYWFHVSEPCTWEQ